MSKIYYKQVTLRQPSINKALILIVCACTIPAVLSAVAAIGYHYAHTRSELFSTSIRRVTAISANVDSVVKSVEIGLLTLTTSPHLEKRDFLGFHRQARSVLVNLPGAHNIYLTDRNGQQLLNTLRPYGTTLPKTGNVEFVKKAVESAETQVSNVFQGAVASRHVIAIAVPVFIEGQVEFILAATIRPEELSALLVKQYLPSDWILSVHDKNGNFVARSRDTGKFLGQPVSKDLAQAVKVQASGTLEGRTREGIAVLAAYTTSSYTGWSAAVGIPKDHLLNELHSAIVAGLMASVLIIGAGLIAAMSIATKIKRGIVSLVPAAEAVSGAEPFSLPPQDFVEIQLVALALQRSSDKLKRSEFAAHHDVLTGLANRAFMYALLPRLHGLAGRNGSFASLLYMDLDGFKHINDTMGHKIGDEVLCIVAKRMTRMVRSSDVCIRLGGDEFAVILQDTSGPGALYTAEKLLKELCLEMHTSAGPAFISASIGYAVMPADTNNVDDLIELADKAMYVAKRTGKDKVCGASSVDGLSSTENCEDRYIAAPARGAALKA